MPGGVKKVLWMWLALACVLMGSISTKAQTPPEQVEAYVLVIKAEQAERDGDLQGAQTLFTEALTLYRQVARDYPKWRPDLVQYRVAHCLNQAERLDRELKKTSESEVQAEEAIRTEKTAEHAPVEQTELLAQNAELVIRIQELEAARTSDQEKIRALEKVGAAARSPAEQAELSDIREAHKALVKENRRLEKAVADSKSASEKTATEHARELQQNKESIGEVEQVVASLRTENEQLELKISELKEHIIPEEQRLAAQSELEKITAEKNEIKQVVDGQELTIRQLKEQLVQVEQHGLAMQNEFNAEREKLNREVSALKETVDLNFSEVQKTRELRSTIKALEKQIIPDKQRLAEKTEREALTEENKALRKSASELTDQVKYIREQLVGVEKEKETADKAFSSRKTALDKEVAELKANLEASRTELRSLKDSKSLIASLEKDKADLAAKVQELQSGIDGERARMENEIKRLSSQNSVMVDEVQEFRDRLDKADRRLRDYERKNAGIPQP